MANDLVIIPREYAGTTIHQRSDGYWNATAMCRATGKLWADYWRNQSTQEFTAELSGSMGIPIDQLIQSIVTGPNEQRGTWVHRRVAIDLARWCSPQFAVLVNGWIEELLTTGRVELTPAPALLTAQSLTSCIAACEHVLSLGGMEDRDRILLKDFARDGMLIVTGKHLQSPNAVAVVISNRCVELGYGPTTLAQDKQIGKLIAAKYRKKHDGDNPPQRMQHVDGAPRPVNHYTMADIDVVDAGIEAYFDKASHN
jgi:hypothetical protein